MKRLISLLSVTILSLVDTSQSTRAGLAFALNEEGLRKSKNVIIRMVNKMFQDLRLDDFEVEFLGTQKISNARFNTVQMNPDDVQVYMRGDHIFIDIL
jgi:hypothetical protein